MAADAEARQRTVVVTGGTSGIGLACVELFAARGEHVVVLARNKERLAQVSDRLGIEAFSVDSSDVSALEAVRDQVGQVDLLVHAAGVLRARRFRRQSLADFQAVVDGNVATAYAAAWAFLPGMVAGSRIVLVSSTAATDPGLAFLSAYAASKAAVRSLAATLRTELEPDGIAVNAVFPDTVDTEMMAITEIPRAALLPVDVAQAVCWLDSLDRRVRVDELVLRPVTDSPFAHTIEPQNKENER